MYVSSVVGCAGGEAKALVGWCRAYDDDFRVCCEGELHGSNCCICDGMLGEKEAMYMRFSFLQHPMRFLKVLSHYR